MYRTDLAAERCQELGEELPRGITREERRIENLVIERVEVKTKAAAKRLGKPPGCYITVTAPSFGCSSEMSEEELEAVAGEIASLLPGEGMVLVVGLGNNDITPDAIGPLTAHQILATRHIDPGSAKESGLGELRPTAAIAPGVLGQTGIETSEIIFSMVKDLNPAAVIVVDALAARSVGRLGNTIQIADSGITPGSGVMNRRKELSRETLGVPVVSIGVPTVVDATTLASDLLDSREEDLDKRRDLFEVRGQTMMITPREIDVLVSHAGNTLALAINKALQREMDLELIQYLTH